MSIRTLAVLASSFVLFAGFSSTALAASEQELSKSVRQLSLKEGAASVALTGAGPSGSCDTARIVFDPTTVVGRMWYATLLEALTTGSSVDVSYERNANLCQLTQVVIR